MSKRSRARETGKKIKQILIEVYEADPEGAAEARREAAVQAINAAVDLPWLSEPMEEYLFDALLQVIFEVCDEAVLKAQARKAKKVTKKKAPSKKKVEA
jgi:hypothetical protein